MTFGLSTSLASWLVVDCGTSMVVGNMVWLMLSFWANGWTVVKMYREGEFPDAGEGSDDSDCESIPEPTSTSSQEAQVCEKDEKEPESIPVLTVGSLARCA
jgi:hypothetical protein